MGCGLLALGCDCELQLQVEISSRPAELQAGCWAALRPFSIGMAIQNCTEPYHHITVQRTAYKARGYGCAPAA